MGFPLTRNLGRYLGVPVLHGRTSAQTYHGIVKRIDQKLTGWKAKSLSLAGRVTLAQAVLAAIPAYVMQSTILPATTCELIDKKIRDFVWGSTEDERKTHLIAWERVCTPKSSTFKRAPNELIFGRQLDLDVYFKIHERTFFKFSS
ncbi:Putative ribonuclease H protein At1g65750 [Linum perenne]